MMPASEPHPKTTLSNSQIEDVIREINSLIIDTGVVCTGISDYVELETFDAESRDQVQTIANEAVAVLTASDVPEAVKRIVHTTNGIRVSWTVPMEQKEQVEN